MHQNVKTFVADLEFTCIYTHTHYGRDACGVSLSLHAKSGEQTVQH